MAKYNEIMDHVKLSEDMQSRILSNVDRQMAKKKRKKLYRIWLPVVGVAVAAAILLLAAKPWNTRSPVQSTEDTTSTEIPVTTTPGGVITGGTEDSTDGTESSTDGSPGSFQMKEFNSAEELAKAAGFPINDLTAIPFNVSEKGYRLIGGALAEEDYVGDNGDISFRKSKGQEDNSGVYEEYSVTKKVDIDGLRVTLQGEADRFHLILWQDDTYSYSLYSLQGLSEKAVQNLVQEIQKN